MSRFKLTHPSWEWHPRVKTGAELSLAERAIDGLAGYLGSPTYIIWQTVVIVLWIILNAIYIPGVWVWHWDARPYILLNLVFSTQAAYAAPIILASQNRADVKREAVAAETHDGVTELRRHTAESRDRLDGLDRKIDRLNEAFTTLLERMQF
jgi:uncharacterized membrane protein